MTEPAAPHGGRRRRRRAPPGTAPGTLLADPSAHRSSLNLISYGDADFDERDEVSVADVEAAKGSRPVLWINVNGLADVALIESLGNVFGLHGLALEDVVNVHQRPKAEAYEDHVFIVTRMALPGSHLDTEQVSIFVGDDFVLTFQERPGDCFDLVRDRLRHSRGRIRKSGPDYLAYALIDAVLDAYFPILEEYGERLERLEDAVISRARPELIEEVHGMKRNLLSLRRAIWPHREMVNELIRDEASVVSGQTRVYLRDCYDHAIQLMDIVETYREIASGLVDIYLSSMSARLNDIMKVLTVIATVFIPLSFIASLYGMNFDPDASPWNMPELTWRFGYPLALLLMAAVAGVLLAYFVRRGWIGPFGRWTRQRPGASGETLPPRR